MGLQPTCAGAEELQEPARQTNACRWGIEIKTCDAGVLSGLKSCACRREEHMLWVTGEDWGVVPYGLSDWFSYDPGFHIIMIIKTEDLEIIYVAHLIERDYFCRFNLQHKQ